MWQYTNECLKHEFEGFWNLFVNVSKHELLHLKAEGFLFKMESISALYLEYSAKDNPSKVQKMLFCTTNIGFSCRPPISYYIITYITIGLLITLVDLYL